MATGYSPKIVTDGLVLYIDAANPKSYPGSGTTWSDLAGSNNGTLTNGPTFDSGNGGSIDFDGSNDYVVFTGYGGTFISNPGLNSGIISFSLWVFAAGGYYILSSGAQTSSTGIAFSYQNGSPFTAVQTGTKSLTKYIGSANFPLNVWLNFTTVSDGSNLILYKNGELFSTDSMNNESRSDTSSDLTLGVPNNAQGSYQLEGKISLVQVYDKVLTASEVLQNYNATKGRYGL